MVMFMILNNNNLTLDLSDPPPSDYYHLPSIPDWRVGCKKMFNYSKDYDKIHTGFRSKLQQIDILVLGWPASYKIIFTVLWQ